MKKCEIAPSRQAIPSDYISRDNLSAHIFPERMSVEHGTQLLMDVASCRQR